MKKVYTSRSRLWRVMPMLPVCALSAGCLPDDAIRQVFGENVILSSAVIIQTVTASVFNSIFGLFGLI